jgi:hypothetical protein
MSRQFQIAGDSPLGVITTASSTHWYTNSSSSKMDVSEAWSFGCRRDEADPQVQPDLLVAKHGMHALQFTTCSTRLPRITLLNKITQDTSLNKK